MDAGGPPEGWHSSKGGQAGTAHRACASAQVVCCQRGIPHWIVLILLLRRHQPLHEVLSCGGSRREKQQQRARLARHARRAPRGPWRCPHWRRRAVPPCCSAAAPSTCRTQPPLRRLPRRSVAPHPAPHPRSGARQRPARAGRQSRSRRPRPLPRGGLLLGAPPGWSCRARQSWWWWRWGTDGGNELRAAAAGHGQREGSFSPRVHALFGAPSGRTCRQAANVQPPTCAHLKVLVRRMGLPRGPSLSALPGGTAGRDTEGQGLGSSAVCSSATPTSS